MTNINCVKNCQYQVEGKCCCDSVILPYLRNDASGNPECPYLTTPDKEKESATK